MDHKEYVYLNDIESTNTRDRLKIGVAGGIPVNPLVLAEVSVNAAGLITAISDKRKMFTVTNGSLVVDAPLPSNSSDVCKKGEIRVGSDFMYVCIANNTWRRASLSNF